MARILIIDDSPTGMMLAVFVLEKAGHATLQAERAAQGIEIARREQPDLILMDIQLPDMDGIEATRILKADPATRDIPVIALSAYAMKGDEEKILIAGAAGYITKPIRYKDFQAQVAAATARCGGPPADGTGGG
ncbi:MAG: response regulator [Rhodocyclales bacterium]|nr:response regulator [Rhodocyclales bacterium]